jgi:hypothetical protein
MRASSNILAFPPANGGNLVSETGTVGVRLRDRRAGLEPGDAAEAEVAEEHLAAIEAVRRYERHRAIEEAE